MVRDTSLDVELKCEFHRCCRTMMSSKAGVRESRNER